MRNRESLISHNICFHLGQTANKRLYQSHQVGASFPLLSFNRTCHVCRGKPLEFTQHRNPDNNLPRRLRHAFHPLEGLRLGRTAWLGKRTSAWKATPGRHSDSVKAIHSHESGYFWNRILFFTRSSKPHCFETALQSSFRSRPQKSICMIYAVSKMVLKNGSQ